MFVPVPGFGNEVDENITTLELYNLNSNGNKRKRSDDKDNNRILTSYFNVYNTDVGFKPLEKKPTLENINTILKENNEFKKSFNSIFKSLAAFEESLNLIKNKKINNNNYNNINNGDDNNKNVEKTNKRHKAASERRELIKKIIEKGSEKTRTICEEIEELVNNTDPDEIPERIKNILKTDNGLKKIQESVIGLTTRSRRN